MALSIKLSDDSINQERCLSFLKTSDNLSEFICHGQLSNNSKKEKIIKLDFSEFGASTLKKLHQIADDSCKRFRLSKALIHQRVGTVDPDESILFMAFSAKDPTNAYQACQFALQRLQIQFPIWKNEKLNFNRIGGQQLQA